MNKLIHVGLERYKNRYTWQLQEWKNRAYRKEGVNFKVIEANTLGADTVVTGSVLDAHSRCYYSLQQMSELVRMIQDGEVTANDFIMFEDMFTPGIESLPYIYNQIGIEHKPKIFVRCWAQSFDPDDFIHRTGMFNWMRQYELMLDDFIDGIFIGSEELAAYIKVAGIKAPVYVVGLPFDKDEVKSRCNVKMLKERKTRVTFSSRWDDEKQPGFFMDLIEYVNKHFPNNNIEFAVLTGRKKLSGSNEEMTKRALRLSEEVSNFNIYTGLEKNSYYSILADSKVAFNCALQDWVSFTALEADALGTATLYPSYKSFPETFFNNSKKLYVAWCVEDAANKLIDILKIIDEAENPEKELDIGKVSNYHNKTVAREVAIMRGQPDEIKKYGRNDLNYRREIYRGNV